MVKLAGFPMIRRRLVNKFDLMKEAKNAALKMIDYSCELDCDESLQTCVSLMAMAVLCAELEDLFQEGDIAAMMGDEFSKTLVERVNQIISQEGHDMEVYRWGVRDV